MKFSVLITALAGSTVFAAPVENNVPLGGVGEPLLFAEEAFHDAPSNVTGISKRSSPGSANYNEPYNPVRYQRPGNAGDFIPESQYRDAMLKVHNECRSAHGVPALKWSQDLVNYAQANTPNCQFAHSRSLSRDKIGENILYGGGSPDGMAKTMWYDNELVKYNFGRQGFSMGTGHMTQMVWKGTSEVGCAVRKCPMGTYVKCNYRRPGNIMGQFEGNVPAPRGRVNYTPTTPNNNYNSQNNYNNQYNNGNYQYKTNGNYQAKNNNNGYYQSTNNGYIYRPTNNGRTQYTKSTKQNTSYYPGYTVSYYVKRFFGGAKKE